MRPSELPRARARLTAYLDDPPSGVRRAAWIPAVAQNVRSGDLYWTTAPMAALAVHAGATLDTWAETQPPSPRGLMVFDGGIGAIPTSRLDLPISAVTWGPQDDGWGLGLFVDWQWSLEHLPGKLVRPDLIPPLVPSGTCPLAPTGEAPETILRAVAASWLLMQQETLAERRVELPNRALRRQAARAGVGDPVLTIVDLCRLYHPDDREETLDEGGSRARYRWVAAGTWRTYRHPRYTPERRAEPQWIPEYVNGPRGAPLLLTERVNVWRR